MRKTLAAWTEPGLPTMGYVQFINATAAGDGLVEVSIRNASGAQIMVVMRLEQLRAFASEVLTTTPT